MIKGKRVFLRAVEERDLPLLMRWRNAPENRRFFFSPFLISQGGQRKWYENLLADPTRIVVMVETLEGQTVGMVGVSKIDWRNQEAEAGQILFDPDFRGQGYAEEAMCLGLDYLFNDLNLHRVYSVHYAFNQGMIAFNRFFGFKDEGVLRQAGFSDGRFQDKVIMGLLREEWRGEQVDDSTN
jgi:RimJ/RimL family protein N-acetyltransferase